MPPAEALFQENCSLKGEIQAFRDENAVLRAQIAWLKKQLFGGGQSERMDQAQLLLTLGELEKLVAKEPKRSTVTYERVAPAPEKRKLPAEAFAHLPVKETIVIEPEEVKAEPEKYERIGEERTFEVDIVPPQAYKREIVRPKYRRKDDRSQAPVVAAAPARPVAGGYASAGLLAWVALSKYVDHLPLYAAPGIKRPMPTAGLCRVRAAPRSARPCAHPA
ncbi:MAG: hypothetical protein ABSA05_11625 [Opitutaceae bacterium]|jgi:transposase